MGDKNITGSRRSTISYNIYKAVKILYSKLQCLYHHPVILAWKKKKEWEKLFHVQILIRSL